MIIREYAVRMMIVDKNGKQQPLGPVSGQNSTGEDSTLVWNSKGDEVWFRSFDSGEPGIVYAVNMYFQSYGAVSIIKVKAYWFHVRERGVRRFGCFRNGAPSAVGTYTVVAKFAGSARETDSLKSGR